ncbi:hypothetical protein FLAN108750_08945 [Flavobacterium antarcticum]|uniref:hypothetical protein n=1 Tax=Flavobacterium antarcticum TaxID=271155 RepID=UPI0003B66527|nr:hypothetical protein [Flavobacterium antarcticum]
MDNFNELHNLENAIYFSNAMDDDRKDKEQSDEETEQSSDWGDVDPAGGPAPSSPGSAV